MFQKRVTLCQSFSLLALTVIVWQCFKEFKEDHHSPNYLIITNAFCRSAPAMQGPIIILNYRNFANLLASRSKTIESVDLIGHD